MALKPIRRYLNRSGFHRDKRKWKTETNTFIGEGRIDDTYIYNFQSSDNVLSASDALEIGTMWNVDSERVEYYRSLIHIDMGVTGATLGDVSENATINKAELTLTLSNMVIPTHGEGRFEVCLVPPETLIDSCTFSHYAHGTTASSSDYNWMGLESTDLVNPTVGHDVYETIENGFIGGMEDAGTLYLSDTGTLNTTNEWKFLATLSEEDNEVIYQEPSMTGPGASWYVSAIKTKPNSDMGYTPGLHFDGTLTAGNWQDMNQGGYYPGTLTMVQMFLMNQGYYDVQGSGSMQWFRPWTESQFYNQHMIIKITPQNSSDYLLYAAPVVKDGEFTLQQLTTGRIYLHVNHITPVFPTWNTNINEWGWGNTVINPNPQIEIKFVDDYVIPEPDNVQVLKSFDDKTVLDGDDFVGFSIPDTMQTEDKITIDITKLAQRAYTLYGGDLKLLLREQYHTATEIFDEGSKELCFPKEIKRTVGMSGQLVYQETSNSVPAFRSQDYGSSHGYVVSHNGYSMENYNAGVSSWAMRANGSSTYAYGIYMGTQQSTNTNVGLNITTTLYSGNTDAGWELDRTRFLEGLGYDPDNLSVNDKLTLLVKDMNGVLYEYTAKLSDIQEGYGNSNNRIFQILPEKFTPELPSRNGNTDGDGIVFPWANNNYDIVQFEIYFHIDALPLILLSETPWISGLMAKGNASTDGFLYEAHSNGSNNTLLADYVDTVGYPNSLDFKVGIHYDDPTLREQSSEDPPVTQMEMSSHSTTITGISTAEEFDSLWLSHFGLTPETVTEYEFFSLKVTAPPSENDYEYEFPLSQRTVVHEQTGGGANPTVNHFYMKLISPPYKNGVHSFAPGWNSPVESFGGGGLVHCPGTWGACHLNSNNDLNLLLQGTWGENPTFTLNIKKKEFWEGITDTPSFYSTDKSENNHWAGNLDLKLISENNISHTLRGINTEQFISIVNSSTIPGTDVTGSCIHIKVSSNGDNSIPEWFFNEEFEESQGKQFKIVDSDFALSTEPYTEYNFDQTYTIATTEKYGDVFYIWVNETNTTLKLDDNGERVAGDYYDFETNGQPTIEGGSSGWKVQYPFPLAGTEDGVTTLTGQRVISCYDPDGVYGNQGLWSWDDEKSKYLRVKYNNATGIGQDGLFEIEKSDTPSFPYKNFYISKEDGNTISKYEDLTNHNDTFLTEYLTAPKVDVTYTYYDEFKGNN